MTLTIIKINTDTGEVKKKKVDISKVKINKRRISLDTDQTVTSEMLDREKRYFEKGLL